MLLILPIILSRISHNFHLLFFIYSHAITYYSILVLKFYCVTCKITKFVSYYSQYYAGIIGSGLLVIFLSSDNTQTDKQKQTYIERHTDTCSSTAVYKKSYKLHYKDHLIAMYSYKEISLELLKCNVETQFKNKI